MRSFEPINLSKEVEQEFTIDRETELVDMSILDILSRHVITYPELIRFVNSDFLLPSEMLTPKGLDRVVKELNGDSNLYLEATNFLDTVSLLDILNYGGSGEGIIKTFQKAIIRSRFSDIGSSTLAMESAERPTGLISRKSSEVGLSVITEEPIVVAVYIFAMVCNLYNIITLIEVKQGN